MMTCIYKCVQGSTESIFTDPFLELVESCLCNPYTLVTFIAASSAMCMNAISNTFVALPPVCIHRTTTHSFISITFIAQSFGPSTLYLAMTSPHATTIFITRIASNVYCPFWHSSSLSIA